MEENTKVEILDENKPNLTKTDNRIFSKAIKKAATKEFNVEEPVLNQKGTRVYQVRRKTTVDLLAEQIVALALAEETPLKDKLAVFEKMAKITEGEKKEQNTNINVGISGSYEQFLEQARLARLEKK